MGGRKLGFRIERIAVRGIDFRDLAIFRVGAGAGVRDQPVVRRADEFAVFDLDQVACFKRVRQVNDCGNRQNQNDETDDQRAKFRLGKTLLLGLVRAVSLGAGAFLGHRCVFLSN